MLPHLKTYWRSYFLVTTHLAVFILGTWAILTPSGVNLRQNWHDLTDERIVASTNIDPTESAIDAKMRDPAFVALCREQARYATLMDQSISLEKQSSLTDAARQASLQAITDQTSALFNSKFDSLKSVKQEARTMIYGKD